MLTLSAASPANSLSENGSLKEMMDRPYVNGLKERLLEFPYLRKNAVQNA